MPAVGHPTLAAANFLPRQRRFLRHPRPPQRHKHNLIEWHLSGQTDQPPQ